MLIGITNRLCTGVVRKFVLNHNPEPKITLEKIDTLNT